MYPLNETAKNRKKRYNQNYTGKIKTSTEVNIEKASKVPNASTPEITTYNIGAE